MSKDKKKEPAKEVASPGQPPIELLQEIDTAISMLAGLLDKAQLDHTMCIMLGVRSMPDAVAHIHVGGPDAYKLSGMASQGNLTLQNYLHAIIGERAKKQMEALNGAQEAKAARDAKVEKSSQEANAPVKATDFKKV